GRKPFSLLALMCSILGSAGLVFGSMHDSGLYAGRVFTGFGMVLALVAITSWVKLISPGPAGATRAALCTPLGFALGPVISGAIVGATASPELAYSVHGVAALAWLLLLFTAKEDSSVDLAGNHSRAEPTTPENLQRFYRIVLPAAPW